MVVGAVLLLVAGIIRVAVNLKVAGPPDDFMHFYRAAKAMLAGRDIYAETNGRYIYPPLLAFLLQPISLLSPGAASLVWAALTSICFGAAAAIMSLEATRVWSGKAHDLLSALVPGALSLLLFGDKVYGNYRLGQSDALTLVCFAAIFRWMNSRPPVAGVAAGAIANVKYLSIIFVPYFVWKKNYRAAAWFIASSIFFLCLPAIEIGPARAFDFIVKSTSGMTRMIGFGGAGGATADVYGVGWERSVSITSSIFRFARAHQFSDVLAVFLILAVLGGFIGLAIAIARRSAVSLFARNAESEPTESARGSLEWSLLTLTAVVFSPQTTLRHMILLLLVFVVALAILLFRRRDTNAVVLCVLVALTVIALSFPWRTFGWREPLMAWRGAAGASWCALLLMLTLVRYGCVSLQQMRPAVRAG